MTKHSNHTEGEQQVSSLLDMFEPGETFATTTEAATIGKPPKIRLWRIDIYGAPEEITKESNNG